MEPLDPAKNMEERGHSKRRISSILKAPRKSTVFPDSKQQENEVEIPKPVEKRNSRRVSFAPANDVLLFAKEVKTGSPTRNPLQELMAATAAPTQNRVQVAFTDDRNEQIMGIENLLTAPLYASQQSNMVNCDEGNDVGEKTVMFSTEVASMDMTCSHTINIAEDAELLGELSHQDHETLHPVGEGRVTIEDVSTGHTATAVHRSAALFIGQNDSSVGMRNISTTVPFVSTDFENFLASLSKPSSSSTNRTPLTEPSSEEMKSQAQDANTDKENHIPKSLGDSRSVGKSFNRSIFCPEDDVSLDMNAGHVPGVSDEDDDPFQCLFPTQDMYTHSDKRSSQMMERKLEESCKSSGSIELTGFASLSRPSNLTGSLEISKIKPILTQSSKQTFNTDGFLLQHKTAETGVCNRRWPFNTSRGCEEPVNEGMACPEDDISMDMTEAQTGFILEIIGSNDSFKFPSSSENSLPSRESKKKADRTSGQQSSEGLGSSYHTDMENSLKTSLKTPLQKHQEKRMSEDDPGKATFVFSDDDVFMDLTQTQTVNIDTDLKIQLHQSVKLSPTPREHTLRVTADDDTAIDMTQCLTENIISNLASDSVTSVSKQEEVKTCDPPYNRSLTSYSLNTGYNDLTSACSVNPVTAKIAPSTAQSSGFTVCPEGDESLDMPEALTGYVIEGDVNMDVKDIPHTNDRLQSLFPQKGTHPQGFNLKKVITSHQQSNDNHQSSIVRETSMKTSLKTIQRHQAKFDSEDHKEKTVRFTAADAGMDVTQSHTANIISALLPNSVPNLDFPAHGETSVRFTAADAGMDVTQSHTVNIIRDLPPHSFPNVDLPANGEKTVRFTTNNAAMDVTPSHTVNIVTDLKTLPYSKMDLSANGEKTVRFTPNDAAMDVTQNHTVNIVTDLNALPHQKMNLSANGEKTVRFTSNDAAMDVTQSHTVNISTDLNKLSHQHINLVPANEEKTERLSTKTVLMDATTSHTVNISTNFEPKSHQNVDFHPGDKTMRFTTDACMDMTSCFTVNIATDAASDLVLPDQNVQPMNEPMDVPRDVKKRNSVVCAQHSNWSSSAQVEEKCGNPMTQEAQATDIPSPQETADLENFQLKTQKPDTHAETESPSLVSVVVENPEMETVTNCAEISANMDLHEPKTDQDQQRTEMFPSSETMKAGAEDQDVDAQCSHTSRRVSLADIQSKVRRLSHIIKAASDNVALGPFTAPLPQLDLDLDKNSNKTMSLPALQPEPEMSLNTENNTETHSLTNAEQPSATTPFNLKTQQLMSRLSVGSFKPKLPQRTKNKESKKLASAGKDATTVTICVTSQLSNFYDVGDINDEELGSCEDISETLDTSIPERSFEEENPSKGFYMLEPLDESALKEEFGSAVHGQKRPLQEDENYKDDEKRLKACSDHNEMAFEPSIECDGNIATTCMMAQTIDSSSSSHTGSKCDAAFESTNKHSLFESQLEEWSSDGPKKLVDGTITVHEFFKLFNIDFVIHNPRQSILPGRFLSDTDATLLDLLKDRHINRPKQTVYEADLQTLTEKVEGLKVRRQDLDKPLLMVNETLWEEIMHLPQNEIKTFGAKLKERISFFRKLSKNQSHEMKEELYSNLVQINLEEQQKLRRKLEEADEMNKHLDDCISELEAELFSVEENGSGDKPSLKALQEELSKVTEALANGDRQISELEMEKKLNSSKVNRLKAEAESLESHIDMLNTMNEWRLREKKDDCMSYTFLHETVRLQLVYGKSDGNDADDGSEKNIANISFKIALDDEKSQSHACLVHKLLSQFIKGEAAWVEKYPTSKHVPKLLHDVSLVVSRCRLLGEELRLLKMWGSVKFDILDISCMDAQVRIVFSSLKRLSKFEVVFDVSLINKLNLFKVQSFKNRIGSASVQQIEEIVSALTPGKNLLTRIVQKIHDTLLC